MELIFILSTIILTLAVISSNLYSKIQYLELGKRIPNERKEEWKQYKWSFFLGTRLVPSETFLITTFKTDDPNLLIRIKQLKQIRKFFWCALILLLFVTISFLIFEKV